MFKMNLRYKIDVNHVYVSGVEYIQIEFCLSSDHCLMYRPKTSLRPKMKMEMLLFVIPFNLTQGFHSKSH